MGGWLKISTHCAITRVQHYPCSKLKMATALAVLQTLSGHHLKKGKKRVTLVQCSLISPHIHPSHARNHHTLSSARKLEDHSLEFQNYQHLMNHLIKRTHAIHGQIIVVTVSLIIVRE
jgi:hypothetical protein